MNKLVLNRFSIMSLVIARRALVVGLLGVVVGSGLVGAQSPDSSAGETRAELLARARRADSLHLREESFLLHSRLQDGDFEVGDRILISYSATALKAGDDSLTVRKGKILPFPEPIGDLNLNGVLRSELQDSVAKRFNKYYKDVVLKVTPLIRLSISGAVRNAGFFYLRSDEPLNDLITSTGGRDQAADLNNVVIKRGENILWSAPDVQSAFAEGLTVQKLGLTSGDEMVVGFKSVSHWNLVIPITSLLISVFVVYRQLHR